MNHARNEKECQFYPNGDSCEGRDVTTRQLVSAFKAGVIAYILYLAIFGTVNYFTGLAIGGPELAQKYAGYFLANGAILVAFVVPGVGVAVAIEHGSISSQLMALMGIAHDYWIDAWVNGMTLVIGIVVQTVSIAYVLLKFYYWFADRKSTLPGVHAR